MSKKGCTNCCPYDSCPLRDKEIRRTIRKMKDREYDQDRAGVNLWAQSLGLIIFDLVKADDK